MGGVVGVLLGGCVRAVVGVFVVAGGIWLAHHLDWDSSREVTQLAGQLDTINDGVSHLSQCDHTERWLRSSGYAVPDCRGD
jgi:hypothetical protein